MKSQCIPTLNDKRIKTEFKITVVDKERCSLFNQLQIKDLWHLHWWTSKVLSHLVILCSELFIFLENKKKVHKIGWHVVFEGIHMDEETHP